jgi:hypothetical protein
MVEIEMLDNTVIWLLDMSASERIGVIIAGMVLIIALVYRGKP